MPVDRKSVLLIYHFICIKYSPVGSGTGICSPIICNPIICTGPCKTNSLLNILICIVLEGAYHVGACEI